MSPHGIIPPVVTPFHADESLDLVRLRGHIDYMIASGVDGIFVLGTTGEFYALEETEKQTVIATAIEHVNGRVPVYAGTGAETTREVIRLTKMAEREGVSGVSVITPYFIKPSQVELVAHFTLVAESVACPVILYNNPSTCGGLNIEPDTVGRLANVPNIVAIKDSSGDLQNTIEILRRTDHQSFSVLMGRDTLILSGLQNGIHGAIPATCNIAPHFCVGIYDSFRSGNLEAARKFQGDLHPIRLAMSLGTGNAAVKESLALLGQSCGPNRMPVTPFSHEKRDHLKSILKTAGLLPKGAH